MGEASVKVVAQGAASARKVDKSEVHKRHDDSVWLQSAQELNAFSLLANFRLPPTPPGPRFADLVEVQRQAGLVQCHRQLPGLSSALFVLTSIEMRIQGLSPSASDPIDGTITARLAAPSDGGNRPKEVVQRFDLVSRDVVATGAASVKFVPRAVYNRLPKAAPRAGWGVDASEQFEDGLTLAPKASDPLLTDHPSDHVTAMEVVCGVEKAVESYLGGSLTGLAIAFQTFAHHHDGPLRFRYSLHTGGRFVGIVTQAEIAKATVTGYFDGSKIS